MESNLTLIAEEMSRAINNHPEEKYDPYYGAYAVRSVNWEKIHKVGDQLKESHVWIDGTKTSELLCGTCGIEIEYNDIDDIVDALEMALNYDIGAGSHQLLLIYGSRVSGGIDRDAGEVVLADAEVLYVVNNCNRRLNK